MANLDKDTVNRDLSRIQQVASQFGIPDINNIDPQTRQDLIERLEKQLGGRRQGQLGSTVRDVGGIWSQGKGYTFDPMTGAPGAVDVGVTPPEAKGGMSEFIMKELIKQRIKEKGKTPTQTFEGEPPEGYEWGLNTKGEKVLKKKSKTDIYDEDLRNTIRGETTYEELKDKYPLKRKQIEEIEAREKPVLPQKGFVAGTGGPISRLKSFFRPKQAELDAETIDTIKQVRTESDKRKLKLELADPMKRRLYEQSGVDVKALEEYFGF